MKDKIKIVCRVGETIENIDIEADMVESVQTWDGGRMRAKMRGATHEGEPVTHIHVRHAEMVFIYMRRRDN